MTTTASRHGGAAAAIDQVAPTMARRGSRQVEPPGSLREEASRIRSGWPRRCANTAVDASTATTNTINDAADFS